MSDLEQFSYDLFVSYGWADIQNPELGDRGWVGEFKRQLELELTGGLGRRARIFLDVEQAHNGELAPGLEAALEQSALFLSIISPGSCKPDSWCRWEVEQFARKSADILPDHRQIFVAMLREVDRSRWPKPLPAIVPYEFLAEAPPRSPLPRTDLGVASSEAGRKLQKLAYDIAKALEEISRETARTVFLAHASTPGHQQRLTRLSAEISARGGIPLRGSYQSGLSETEFAERSGMALRRASLSVHLVESLQDGAPANWSDSLQNVQLRVAAARFSATRDRIIIWHESMEAQEVNSEAAKTARILTGTGFEYLESLLSQSFRKQTAVAEFAAVGQADAIAVAAAAGAVTVQSPSAAAAAAKTLRYVFVECVPEDLEKLDRIRPVLEAEGIRMRAPLFQGDEAQRKQLDEAFLNVCHGVAVYFGSRNDLQAFLACQFLWAGLRKWNRNVPKAVLIEPYSDPIRRSFLYPEFENYPGNQVDEFVRQVRGV